MIPKEFDYVAPGSVQEVLTALRGGGDDAKVLAGGHSLIPLIKLRLSEPTLLVDLRNVGDLRGVRGSDGHLDIGAMTTHYMLHTTSELIKSGPLLVETAYSIGDAQVRARGTLGGSIAHADPAADLPAAILALEATLVLSSLGDGGVIQRELPASQFFVDLFTTAMRPGELLTAIRVPNQAGRTGSAYVKVRNKASHYALVGAAAVLTFDESGNCSDARVAVTGAAAVPFRLTAVEKALAGTKADEASVQSALGTLGDLDVAWMSDLHGSEEYRRHLTGVVASRAVEKARSRVG